jgi:D-glycero-alpha-D-manno-heptose-7-phosphate kinase
MGKVITRAPLRISFAGGGTDIEPYPNEYGGCVLNAAIQFYAQAIYPSELIVPSEMERIIKDYFATEYYPKLTNGAPQMSGLGGSAACFVAGIKAVSPHSSNWEIARLAYKLERNNMAVAGGKQDQYISAFGGLNFMTFNSSGVEINPIPIPDGLEDSLILVYMGQRRTNGADIIKDQMGRDNSANFRVQKEIAQDMKTALFLGHLDYFGSLLEMAWLSKIRFSPLIATDKIKEFHADCLKHGAMGGKLTGAGGGGYMLLMESPHMKGELRTYLSERKIPYLDVKIDTEGVKIVD